MFTRKSSKGAVTASVISLVICFAMLLGTTFAWFSTSLSSSVNTIKSGNLTIDLVDENGETVVGKTLKFVDADGVVEDALWEPGLGYTVQDVYLKNTGSCDIKFKVDVIGINGDADLVKVIDWTVNGAAAEAFEDTLASGETYGPITLAGSMKETAGNQYMNKTADGIAIGVYATQVNATDYEEVVAIIHELEDVPTVSAQDLINGTTVSVPLDTAYTFLPVEDADDAQYLTWNADYVITFNQDVAENSICLAGQYDSWDDEWVAFLNPVALEAGQEYRLLKDARDVYVTYDEVLNNVQEFNCGAASLTNAAGLTATVELRLYERVNGVETGTYVIAGTYTYAF